MIRPLGALTLLLCGSCTPSMPPAGDCTATEAQRGPFCEGTAVIQCIALACTGILSCLAQWCFGEPYYLADPSCRSLCQTKGTTQAQNLFSAWLTCVQMKAGSDCSSACFNVRWPENACVTCIDQACQTERALCEQQQR